MEKRMLEFLKSLKVSDPSSYDLSFSRCEKDKNNRYKVLFFFQKEVPWNYSLLEEFMQGLTNLRYLYDIHFSYEKAPTLEDYS